MTSQPISLQSESDQTDVPYTTPIQKLMASAARHQSMSR